MTQSAQAALDYAVQNRLKFEDELVEFVSIPSISTDPAAKSEMQHAAAWVAQQLQSLGAVNIQIMPTAMHPVVYGEIMKAPGRPVLLIYGHYDVQPVEPLELWVSPPFNPQVRGDNLYGRGASDMKGQVMVMLKAIEALIHTGSLNVNLKFIIEGEEEIGSPSLDAFLKANKDLLSSDLAINADTGMLGPDTPTITYALRGLAYFEIRLTGPATDLHSGIYGGAIHNPAQVLCDLVAGMKDADGRITLPGFYDSVRELSAEEHRELARLPVNDETLRAQTGAPALFGEAGYTPVERLGARPTLDVNGLLSGFTGEGSKTVLPAKAMAKISMRLVPDQDPQQVHQQLLRYMEAHAPESVRWEVIKHAGGPPSITNLHIPGVEALVEAMEQTWGKRPLFKREGGSVPVVAQMCNHLGIESVLTGFGLPDDNLHAPNEKIHLPTFHRGIETIIRYLAILGNR